MTISLRKYLRNAFRLGSGEAVGRVCNIAIVVLLGHCYGVAVLGIYALGMTLAGYLQPAIDFGLKHVGARLVARFPESATEIVRRVQRRRLAMAGATIPLVLLYAFLANFPPDKKIFLFVFSSISAMYALSLEWAAWGREQLRLVGMAKAIV